MMKHAGRSRSPDLNLVVLGSVAWLAVAAHGADFHVAPTGDDAAQGSAEAPFRSLERARDAVREQRRVEAAEPVTVFVHGGDYPLAKTFELSKADSGTAEAPVVWRAWRSEKPVLIGGQEITGWQPVLDDARTGGRLVKADLAAQGLDRANFSQLLCAGRRQPAARWPNVDPNNPYGGGWAFADGSIVSMYADVPGEDKRSFTMKADDLKAWARPTDGEVSMFPRYNWWNNIVRIAAIDPASRRVTLAADCSYAIRPGDRYFVQGMREELDAPGEWYHDRDAKTLLFVPPEPIDGQPVFVPVLSTILAIGPDTEHVTIRGLAFQCCEGTAITLRNTRHCTIAGCTIQSVGNSSGSGVSVSGSDNAVVGCDISHTGAHGIAISGGDRLALTPACNRAENNVIHHTGVLFKQGVGVSLSGVGNRAAHNLIHDCPRFGIMFSGNNLTVEFNHVHHVCLETQDTGAIYTGGRDWISSRGSVIRHNFLHDVPGFSNDVKDFGIPHFSWGIYLDDNTGGVDVIGNIVARCTFAGIHLHNGRDNRIVNNVFVDAGQRQIQYSGWTREHKMWIRHLPTMVKGYESVAGQPAWATLRNMHTHPNDAVLPDGLIMTGNEFRRNIIDYRDPRAKLFEFKNLPVDHYASDDNVVWHQRLPLRIGPREGRLAAEPAGATPAAKAEAATPGDDWVAWRKLGFDTRSVVEDPLFVDRDHDDFRLLPESPALRLGFEPIPVEKIGPYADELRASWPIGEASD